MLPADIPHTLIIAMPALALLTLLLPGIAQADVIFPAFSAIYIFQVFLPYIIVGVLVIEILAYKRYCPTLPTNTAIRLAVVANLVSWLAGVVITGLLPSGLIPNQSGRLSWGRHFVLYSILGFFVAYVLSVLIEGACLQRAARKHIEIVAPYRMSLYANTAGYAILALLTTGLMGFNHH